MADDLKAMSKTKSAKFGHFIVEFATPGIGHILKSAGCDFVLFDLEHSGFHFETVKSVLRYFEAAQLPAIVRVPSKEYQHIARAMLALATSRKPCANSVAESGRPLGAAAIRRQRSSARCWAAS